MRLNDIINYILFKDFYQCLNEYSFTYDFIFLGLKSDKNILKEINGESLVILEKHIRDGIKVKAFKFAHRKLDRKISVMLLCIYFVFSATSVGIYMNSKNYILSFIIIIILGIYGYTIKMLLHLTEEIYIKFRCISFSVINIIDILWEIIEKDYKKGDLALNFINSRLEKKGINRKYEKMADITDEDFEIALESSKVHSGGNKKVKGIIDDIIRIEISNEVILSKNRSIVSIEELSLCIEKRIPRQLIIKDANTRKWFKLMMKAASMAFQEKKKWILSPNENTYRDLTVIMVSSLKNIISGNWDKLERVDLKNVRKSNFLLGFIFSLFKLIKTLFIAIFPLISFLILQLSPFGLDEKNRLIVYIILLLWAGFTLLLKVDPDVKEKLSLIKDAKDLLTSK